MEAAGEGHTHIVQALLAHGADVNAKNKFGCTALMMAAVEGHADIVQALLSQGADVNAKDNDGYTALLAAEQMGHKEIVRMLKKDGAKVSGDFPQSDRLDFLDSCIGRGLQRGDDPDYVKRFCNCSWEVISAGMTLGEFREMDRVSRQGKRPQDLPQLRRILKQLEDCKKQ
jgi:ankyrin repeat protein